MNDFNWFHLVSTLAGDDYLKMDKVLDENAGQCLAFLSYLDAKHDAELAQFEFESKLKKNN